MKQSTDITYIMIYYKKIKMYMFTSKLQETDSSYIPL